MSLILLESRCPDCGEKLVKDPDCTGDYYFTVNGLQLQSFCISNNECNGNMFPFVSIDKDIGKISNTEKRVIDNKLAGICKRGCNELHDVSKSLSKVRDRAEYEIAYSKRARISLKIVVGVSRRH